MDKEIVAEKYFFYGNEFSCSLMLALNIIGGKWKSLIIYYLKDGAMRSGMLQKRIGIVSNKVYAQALHELEQDGIIKKTVHPVSPPCVEYELTPIGFSVLPIVMDLAKWGRGMSENIVEE